MVTLPTLGNSSFSRRDQPRVTKAVTAFGTITDRPAETAPEEPIRMQARTLLGLLAVLQVAASLYPRCFDIFRQMRQRAQLPYLRAAVYRVYSGSSRAQRMWSGVLVPVAASTQDVCQGKRLMNFMLTFDQLF